MLTTLLAATPIPSDGSNSAWTFVKKNFIDFEFFSTHVEVNLRYGTVAIIGVILIAWFIVKLSKKRSA